MGTGEPPTYENIDEFHEGLAAFFNGTNYGYLDTSGKIAIKPAFFFAQEFSDGLACVQPKFGELFEYIDKTGAVVIGLKFSEADSFAHGEARVRFKGAPNFSIIDRTGKVTKQLPI